MNSIHLRWSPFFENQLASCDRSRYSVGRILEQRKSYYVLPTEDGREVLGSLAGKLQYEVSGRGELPSVGDRVWFKVGRELASLACRQDKKAQNEWKKRWKAIAVADRKRSDSEGVNR